MSMPETTLEQMRRAYEALSRGDVEAAVAMIDPDAEMRDRPEIPDPRTYHGHEGAREALAQNVEAFETVEFTVERMVESGDRIAVVLRMRARGRESGAPVEDRIAHLWTLRNGRPFRLQVYSDPEKAIEALEHG